MSTLTAALSTELADAPITTTTESARGNVISARGQVESDPMPVAAPAPQAAPPVTLTGDISRIVLTGFMGAGKTTVGRRLAAQLGWEFVDLDTLIEQRTGMTVPQIFAERGEVAFRRIESHALAVALGRKSIVLALGGGALETLTNRLLLEQTPGTVNVYLHAPLDVLVDRCLADVDGTERPVLAKTGELSLRFAQRMPHYERIAAITVDTTAASADEAVTLLHRKLTAK